MRSKSDKYWKSKLTDEQYRALRDEGTEAPFSGTLLDNKKDGSYVCAACGAKLFSSDKKYDSGSGWPSFTDVVEQVNVELTQDSSHGISRAEVACSSCGGHLGHVFSDGPELNGQRYCINSASLDFDHEKK